MKKFKKFLMLALMICLCGVIFAGCTNPLTYSIGIAGKAPYTETVTGNSYVELEETASVGEIIDAYLDITFTVCIYQVSEVTKNGETTKDEVLYSYGSGFIIHTGGFILTNNHVITYLTQEAVTTSTTSGLPRVTTTTTTYYKCYVSQDGGETIYEAELLWNNPVYDMGIVICEDFDDLPAAKLKDRTIYCSESEKLQTLEQLLMVGNQKSYSNCYDIGNLASNELKVAIGDSGNFYEHLIKHTVTINHGSSGSPLIDLNGNVIGVNTLGDDAANEIFFAVSIYPAIAILDAVVENYYADASATSELTFGFSGTDALRDANSESPLGINDPGLYVSEVNSGCIINGLQVGDYIVGITVITEEGTSTYEVWDNNTLMYGKIHLLYAQSGSVVVMRGGVRTTLSLVL